MTEEIPPQTPEPLEPAAAVEPEQPLQQEPAASRKKRNVLIVVVAAVVVATVAVILMLTSQKKAPPTHTVFGVMQLVGGKSNEYASTCEGKGGYSDISQGTSVTVTDGAGKIIGTGHLDEGTGAGSVCTFGFTVKSVPDTDFYKIEISHRGGLTFSREEMAAQGWIVSASLGE
ncbi:MAG: hypothetical protein JWM93_2428 [Frankiales bacterium]|nr:hypothetical protein [Frankiales bacterium]